jgi:hypothetical protein
VFNLSGCASCIALEMDYIHFPALHNPWSRSFNPIKLIHTVQKRRKK